MPIAYPCGVIFHQMGPPRDPDGCRLPDQHEGAHEFVDEYGKTWQWETDWECDCDHCRTGDGDWCMIYWEATRDNNDAQQR